MHRGNPQELAIINNQTADTSTKNKVASNQPRWREDLKKAILTMDQENPSSPPSWPPLSQPSRSPTPKQTPALEKRASTQFAVYTDSACGGGAVIFTDTAAPDQG
ncbi:hypothetical protein DID88_010340 [Monilinia fructigena]|uniref:Uncharacterized protein n=1 Tax=Monilinia fructigena TaxID=38457 RepID=A0A395IM83_9HELO|nr:hypothetical protein DID88_010340 [Monilinia fructigena]